MKNIHTILIFLMISNNAFSNNSSNDENTIEYSQIFHENNLNTFQIIDESTIYEENKNIIHILNEYLNINLVYDELKKIENMSIILKENISDLKEALDSSTMVVNGYANELANKLSLGLWRNYGMIENPYLNLSIISSLLSIYIYLNYIPNSDASLFRKVKNYLVLTGFLLFNISSVLNNKKPHDKC